MPLDILAFVRKWNASTLTERSAAPQHFRDLCEALGVPHPTEEDVEGSSYTYEKHVTKAGGREKGFADVWKRGYFAWEYKSKGGDLNKAYRQLNEYHDALENPPLLITCDFERFVVHTKFENLPSRTYAFKLDDLLVDKDTPTSAIPPLEVLRHVFGDYNQLRPGVTAARVTEAAAADLLRLAKELELERAANKAPYTKEQIAHFIMRLVFCLFADSIGLLPNHVFRNLVKNDRFSPRSFNKKLPILLNAMSSPGGFFGADDIRHFNGDLFRPDDHMLELNGADLGILYSATQHDWSHIEPAIFGTLFERSLDASKRSMIGAHYTSTDDILLLIEPVVIDPLRRRWAEVQQRVLDALAEENNQVTARGTASRLQLNRPALTLLQDWADELSRVRILDPACGSGNFLYVALKRLLDLWQEARNFGLKHGLTLALDPIPSPAQLFGIEIDFYAHEIASIVVWIGFLQWKHDHGVKDEKEPLLQKLTNIAHADAIMRYDESTKSKEFPNGKPYEPDWPTAEYVIGNPPFLGGKSLRREIGDAYVDDLFALYKSRVRAESDLVTYWFEKARAGIERAMFRRAGLLATQAIRQGANRNALTRIKESGNIFFAWSDRPWQLNGAAVRISMVGFDDGSEKDISLDGITIDEIHSNLTSGLNLTAINILRENLHLAYQGPVKVGKFEMDDESARKMLTMPNPNGMPNSDVIKPWFNGGDITDRFQSRWIVDFGKMNATQAALYEAPFEYLKKVVKPSREKNRDRQRRENWWQLGRSGGNLKDAAAPLSKIIVTSRVSKHRFFIWAQPTSVPDTRVVAVARDDDYFFGMLHSRMHKQWFLMTSSRHGDGDDGGRPTYNPSVCFDTFPFPWPPGKEPSEADDSRVKAIADAARELVRLRDAWLNPVGASEAELKERTLTKLYNKRPEWLANAHATLDKAVFAAYGWPDGLSDQEILARLLTLNDERAAQQEEALTSKRRSTKEPQATG